MATSTAQGLCLGMFHWFLRRLRAERGFTLIELLIVVAVMGILTAILIPNFMRSRSQAQISASKANVKHLATALEVYYTDKQSYPTDTTLGVLVAGNYARAIPPDPCSSGTYTYTPTGSPPTSYTLQTPSWATTGCAILANGLSYSPGGGLVQY